MSGLNQYIFLISYCHPIEFWTKFRHSIYAQKMYVRPQWPQGTRFAMSVKAIMWRVIYLPTLRMLKIYIVNPAIFKCYSRI